MDYDKCFSVCYTGLPDDADDDDFDDAGRARCWCDATEYIATIHWPEVNAKGRASPAHIHTVRMAMTMVSPGHPFEKRSTFRFITSNQRGARGLVYLSLKTFL